MERPCENAQYIIDRWLKLDHYLGTSLIQLILSLCNSVCRTIEWVQFVGPVNTSDTKNPVGYDLSPIYLLSSAEMIV